jgi:hypothetical protein
MDSLAFIATLGVGVAVMTWYFACEARGSDGGIGLFAIKNGPEPSNAGQLDDDLGRYRMKSRLTPDRRAGLRAPMPEKAYRAKADEKPAWRAEADGALEADKEY